MVRPRLVEEGTPIGQADDNNDHHDDHVMAEQSSSFEGMGYTYTQDLSQHQPATSYVAQTTATADKPSSLLAAARGKLPSKRRQAAHTHATRVIIGGESPDPGSLQPDCIDMATDSPFEQRSSARGSDLHYDALSTSAQPMHQQYQHPRQYSSTATPTSHHHKYRQATHSHTQHIEIGADTRPSDRMEGVQDHSIKTPLIVLDGANVAYAYSQTAHAAEYQQHQNQNNRGSKIEPDATGIRVACDYFLKADMRVMVVLPAPWFRSKPRPGDVSHGNASMLTDQLEVLQELQQAGRVLTAPPSDDDDAYALTIAQRENVRAASRNGQGPAYVLSNDMFRDAQARDPTGQVRPWLTTGHSKDTGPGRISFAFCDMGTMNDYGETELDIVPNPRHPLVAWIEQHHSQQHAAS